MVVQLPIHDWVNDFADLEAMTSQQLIDRRRALTAYRAEIAQVLAFDDFTVGDHDMHNYLETLIFEVDEEIRRRRQRAPQKSSLAAHRGRH